MDTVQQIKERLDVVDIIGSYVELKPAGGSRMKARCPFHKEKTPSFYVSRDKQLWTCFGCGKGGDLFTFVMEMESMDFTDALRYLAEKAGVEVVRFKTEDANKKTRLADILELAAKFYSKALRDSSEGARAREYLASRGVGDELADQFRLGFAPDLWSAFSDFAEKRGFRAQELVDSGLSIPKKNERGIYDRFRLRLMFPICDAQGKVIGFTGRQLDETREGGKYINTPETLLYQKSRVLYGLHLARQAIKSAGHAIIVEGNMDVIASHKAGAGQVVASSGTALTAEQLALLKRFTETILVCFDADSAGERAAKRGIDLAIEAGFTVKIIIMPRGIKDPDECVSKDQNLWLRAISEARDVMTYYFEKVFAKGLPKTGEEKKIAAKLLIPELARLSDKIEQAHWARELAERLNVDEKIIYSSMEAVRAVSRKAEMGESEKGERQNVAALDRRALICEAVLGAIISRDDFRSALFSLVDSGLFPENHYLALYNLCREHYNVNSEGKIPEFSILRQKTAALGQEAVIVFDRLSLKGEVSYAQVPVEQVGVEAERLAFQLTREARTVKMKEIEQKLREAEALGDAERIRNLTDEFQKFLS